MVTIPTVRMFSCLHTPAIIGLAPVPVPPPMPAVIKHILVPSDNNRLISSTASSASRLAISGLAPAPKPVPNCIFTGTGEFLRLWLSVLHTANETLSMPSRYILLTALHPPPPTPITLMMSLVLSSISTSKSSIFYLFLSEFPSITYSDIKRMPSGFFTFFKPSLMVSYGIFAFYYQVFEW